ncbi:MAG TPA: UvrD-helicase domain-containing protein [Candidatus Blautia avistercoris]|uniref:UvrD-helicase domain-containing protein n=1 Tax=Blautia sp. An249 TaxID=1965603 RepID=UPI000B36CA71|nr:UvrD-helicase domain-containing protein [Blautia sp. An249]OUO79973.1 hypothetical protein B5F53_05830 [Blautia sp. An249]HIY19928.1 UvrD-helicase domain-containing protein [Candidatus Blautia avistercoris]
MYIADLHIHSRYSRATSKDCTPEYLDLWARKKGIHLVGSGDFTHPQWREELKEKLEPAEDGLYVLKEEYRIRDASVTDSFRPRFVITGEISSIYKKNGRVRKVHSLLLLPGLEEAQKVSGKLENVGNIHSDGRPILGLDCRDLLEIMLDISPEGIYVPAHIWTPHFSMFGAFSGFDSAEECFEDLTPYIHAVETGLSSDPPMNWRVSALDKFHLISNSDAHSPAKLGREANLLDIEMSYQGLYEAIQKGKGLYGTIEFFPEEGKYHMDGHRKCNLCLTPSQTEKYQGICPVCGRKITIGVSHRVEQLADREEGYEKKDAKAFESLVPLPEIIGSAVGHAPSSKAVQKEYEGMLKKLGPEFEILRTIPTEEIASVAGHLIGEGIQRLREGKVERIPGFDGEYGTIRFFGSGELNNLEGQMDFFSLLDTPSRREEKAKTRELPVSSPKATPKETKEEKEICFNEEQMEAVRAQERGIAVIAGPGTGKTQTLISHLCYLLENRKVKPSMITAVTFTNQAAGEIRERLERKLGKKRSLRTIQVGTFHKICLDFLKARGREFTLLDQEEAKEAAREVLAGWEGNLTPKEFLERRARTACGKEPEAAEETWEKAVKAYEQYLKERNLLDFDGLLLETLKLTRSLKERDDWRQPFTYLLVDEFQDVNPVQYELIKEWNKVGREIFAIGDPDQAIYGFRGSDAECFRKLARDFPDMHRIRLKENYRCSPRILRAGAEVISQNPGGERLLHGNREEGEPVRMVHTADEFAAAVFTAKEINRLVGGMGMLEAQERAWKFQDRKVRGFGEIAVLYRTHRQADLLERCLKQEGIPYVVAGRDDFLQDEKVRGSICFFRYLEEPENSYAKEQAARLLWNLEEDSMAEQVLQTAREQFLSPWQKKKPQKFMELWMETMELQEQEAVRQLKETAVFYKTMKEFLNSLVLGTESDLKRCPKKEYAADAVTLTTLHGAKGKEFPVVVIYGAEKGKIPLERKREEIDVEEERRLLYVGMTRAKEELILTGAKEESPFLAGLSEEILHREKAGRKKPEEYGHQMSLFE